VHAHPIRGNICQRVIQRLHLNGRRSQELVVGHVAKSAVPAHGQIRAIHLQQQSRIDDRFVLRLHGVRQRLHVGGVRRVIFVRLEDGDGSRRNGVHKAFGGFHLGQAKPSFIRAMSFFSGSRSFTAIGPLQTGR
jgi:hypothetical protein